ncbi:hypothetical protein NQ314_009089 [Rhamnusium bicolor]|uniref:Uncharacterized protein n=1 Tax=Rhamnusium bicolor TaxID=1586634 RepID=A0AAV8Y522_9CUCU|nr:hypothetical protein NQ314_009089 [Rhamnusium bicolor]
MASSNSDEVINNFSSDFDRENALANSGNENDKSEWGFSDSEEPVGDEQLTNARKWCEIDANTYPPPPFTFSGK